MNIQHCLSVFMSKARLAFMERKDIPAAGSGRKVFVPLALNVSRLIRHQEHLTQRQVNTAEFAPNMALIPT